MNLKKSGGHLHAEPAVKYQFIADHHQEFMITVMCRVLGVSRSGYYAWHPEKPCPRELENQVLIEQTRVEYKISRQTYGSPRIWVRLLGLGVSCGARVNPASPSRTPAP